MRNIIVTQPELACVGMPIDMQLRLLELGGVWFERVFAITQATGEGYPISAIAQSVRTVGIASTIMATDLGQPRNPPPVEGMRRYINAMREEGMSMDAIEQMTCVNPAAALGIGMT